MGKVIKSQQQNVKPDILEHTRLTQKVCGLT